MKVHHQGFGKEFSGRLMALLCIGTFSALVSGCGQFGEKPFEKKILGMGEGGGCLNNLGPTAESYVKGELSPGATGETFDCIIDNMGMFRRFVKGSAGDGSSYTPQDIRALISNFLVTDREIPFSLIQAGFAMKASMFGGSGEAITPDEFDRVHEMVKVLKSELIRLIPNVRSYHQDRGYQSLLAFADAMILAAKNFQGAFKFAGNLPFPKEQARVLVNDLGRLFGWDFPAAIVDFAFSAKVVMMGGSAQVIENWAWNRLFHMGGSFGGVILGIASADIYPKKNTAEAIRYFLELGKRVEKSLHESIEFHGGGIPVADIERAIDDMPESWTPLPKSAMKSALRPAINKLFRSRLKDRIEHRSVDYIFGLLQSLGKTQAHIESIYVESKASPDGLTRSEFEQAAQDYVSSLNDDASKQEVSRLIRLVKTYKALYWRDELSVHFGDLETYSLRYVSMLSLIDYGLGHLIESYSGSIRLSRDQFTMIFSDFEEILDALGVVKAEDNVKFAEGRFMEANIFVEASNGDSNFDRSEGVYYILNVISFSALIPKMTEDLQEICRLGDNVEGARPTLDPECFKREVVGRSEDYLSRFPFLLDLFRTLTPERKSLMIGYLMAAGKDKKSPAGQFMPADLDGFVGFLHFSEGIFQRVDRNKDDILTFDEVEAIFPVYRGLLFEMVSQFGLPSFLKGDGILLGAFAYVLRFAKVPAGVFDAPHIVLWLTGTKANWIVHSDRFTVIKALSNMAKVL